MGGAEPTQIRNWRVTTMTNNIINKIINGEFQMVRSMIAAKYQTIRQDDMDKLKIDIVTTERLTDPIYITSENKIIDGWKRLVILQELYQEGFKLAVEPIVIIVDGSEKQEDIYITKNVMVNRYKKSWLAVMAAENNLPETRRIATARRGIKQTDKYDACDAAGLAFGISGKLVQQADDILKSSQGDFFRMKIRNEEITVTNAYEIVNRELNSILNDMKNGKTYRQAMNDFMRDGQGTRQHNQFQERQRQTENNPLEFETYITKLAPLKPIVSSTPIIGSTSTQVSAEAIITAAVDSACTELLKPISKIISLHSETQSVSNQTKFFGALSADCPDEFKNEMEQLMRKYIPNSHIVFVHNRLKLQQLVHENLNYEDILEAA